MANHVIDISSNDGITTITAAEGGTVTNDVSVVIKEGVTKSEAQVALQSIVGALIGDAVVIE